METRGVNHLRQFQTLGAGGVDLGAELLELGPGPGMTTEVLQPRVARVTAVELDAALAGRLACRLAGSGVRVVQGDGTALPFQDRSFDAAAVFTMLHHIPLEALQDRLLADLRSRPANISVAVRRSTPLRRGPGQLGPTTSGPPAAGEHQESARRRLPT